MAILSGPATVSISISILILKSVYWPACFGKRTERVLAFTIYSSVLYPLPEKLRNYDKVKQTKGIFMEMLDKLMTWKLKLRGESKDIW